TTPRSNGWSTFPCWTTPMSDPGGKNSGDSDHEMKRAPFRAWLVTGPVGRLVGFFLDFARALRAHRAAKRD
ncbi:MAG: hypothetical protein KDB64_10950, partial [Solirubrobacterales bacterium]|nr:hypothetical protein [Solirubrobacterales bacterium]